MTTQAPEPAVAVVDADVACPCGYNLRGLSLGGRCPECALPVEEGLRLFNQPFDAEQLRRVVGGIRLMLIAHVGWLLAVLALAPQWNNFWAYGLLGVAGPTTFLTLIQLRSGNWLVAGLVIRSALVLTPLLYLIGVWKVTTRPRPGRAGAATAVLGRCTRYVAVVGWAAICLSYLWWEDVMVVGSVLYDAVAAALLWTHLARLVRHAGLHRLSILTWSIGGTLVTSKLMFAANMNLGFDEPVFWVVIVAFALAGVIASLFLFVLRRSMIRLLVP